MFSNSKLSKVIQMSEVNDDRKLAQVIVLEISLSVHEEKTTVITVSESATDNQSSSLQPSSISTHDQIKPSITSLTPSS